MHRETLRHVKLGKIITKLGVQQNGAIKFLSHSSIAKRLISCHHGANA